MPWICGDVSDRDLMCPPEALQVVLIDLPRSRPAFGAAQDDHRPARPQRCSGASRLLLDLADLKKAMLQSRSHRPAQAPRITASDEGRRVPAADDQSPPPPAPVPS